MTSKDSLTITDAVKTNELLNRARINIESQNDNEPEDSKDIRKKEKSDTIAAT